MRYSFLEPAREELEKAVAHYENEREGLGKEFAEEVDNTIQRILNYPAAWTPLSNTIRRCRTNRFPYGIVYGIREDEVIIVAVMHLHQKPGYWKTRLDK